MLAAINTEVRHLQPRQARVLSTFYAQQPLIGSSEQNHTAKRLKVLLSGSLSNVTARPSSLVCSC